MERGGGKGHGVGREGRGTFVAYARLRDMPSEAVEASMMMMVMPYLLDLISTKREVQRVGWMGGEGCGDVLRFTNGSFQIAEPQGG